MRKGTEISIGCTSWTVDDTVVFCNILHLSNTVKDGRFSDVSMQLAVLMWSFRCQRSLYRMHVQKLFTVDSRLTNVVLGKSLIMPLLVLKGVLTPRKFGRGKIIGHRYCTLIYKALRWGLHTTEAYAKKFMMKQRRNFLIRRTYQETWWTETQWSIPDALFRLFFVL